MCLHYITLYYLSLPYPTLHALDSPVQDCDDHRHWGLRGSGSTVGLRRPRLVNRGADPVGARGLCGVALTADQASTHENTEADTDWIARTCDNKSACAYSWILPPSQSPRIRRPLQRYGSVSEKGRCCCCCHAVAHRLGSGVMADNKKTPMIRSQWRFLPCFLGEHVPSMAHGTPT